MTPTTAAGTDAPPWHRRSPILADGLFLASLVILSTLLYVGALGFYSDDWAFLGALSTAEDPSFVGLLRTELADPNLAMRPTQALWQVVLFRLFGLEPLGYHLVNVAVIVGVTIALSGILRRIGLSRGLAVAVPAVYALMPNHATNRFWFASFGYLLSLGLYLVGLHADLRAASSDRRAAAWRWKALALAALALAALGYEVVLPLFLVNVVLTEVVARRARQDGLRGPLGTVGRGLFHGTTIAIAVLAVVYKSSVAVNVGYESSFFAHALWLASGAVVTDFGTYGVGFPHTVAWSLPHAGLAGVVAAIAVGAAVAVYLQRVPGPGRADHPGGTRRDWLRLGLAGIVVFALGYAIFLTTGRVGFSSTGIANRVAAAAAVGSSIVLVAAVGWAGATLGRPATRARFFRAGVGILCASGLIVVNALGSFWAESWRLQREILADVHAAFPVLSSGSTLLLDGVCPYVGPAHVFASHWDLRGALVVRHRDPSLDAGVASAIVAVDDRGVETRVYRWEVRYPYGSDLLLYDRRTGASVALTDRDVAQERLSSSPAEGCPPGGPGTGTVWLPFDTLRGWVQRTLGL